MKLNGVANIDLQERFQSIRSNKMFTEKMAVSMTTWNRFEIVMVCSRSRKDIHIVVDQMYKRHTYQRSDYANYLWNKSGFKNKKKI
ncbi:hypothetical protein [Macrococcoides caseolyticum]|uniref:Uncharacterized protein n=1 Tax=Macrococcus psychrotolerans TaxID=3039389 RepID=A0AAT9P873_9STAP|nr:MULTISPECIES: hypothetical protein [Macrococcus]PKE47182.1 hypothetical protein CW677_09125 [Macrococcus caseolyticus]PKE67111.1 hypothetical protein CW663_09700 [Macrococcus caseolyticus]PKF13956.1 hypothetical protein CW690_09120 [Macrococcus caseolyticus]QYA34156.1 hypothetical protein KYI10_12025 [Macrococcus sp. 19Msa1099]QYA38957.1 hypothetical protein KYI07_12005 [Macrococcus caseolyticus]